MRHSALLLLTLLVIILASSTQVYGWNTLQVGVRGDKNSVNSSGVGVAVRTHIYRTREGELDYFWVGVDLADGSFIQFGYSLQPGDQCLKGQAISGTPICQGSTEEIGLSDARWQWQYWPNRYWVDYYWGIGPANSVGLNGTWNTYSISPGEKGVGWSFQLNGKEVDRISFGPSQSIDPVKFIAEKGFNSQNKNETLGPVEFRNLEFLKGDGWHLAQTLTANMICAPQCNLQNPFGVAVDGAGGYMIAGSGIKQPPNGMLLWSGKPINYPS
jgi:hypothetical protein